MALFLSRIRLASLALTPVYSVEENAEKVSSWRYGEIELANGRLNAIYPRWWPRMGSLWESRWDNFYRTMPADHCIAYYAFPHSAPGYMSVLYARSGPNTQYKTVYSAVSTMDQIAKLRNSNAIVCQMVSQRGTERLMNRWGYVRHATSLGDNHYIKRLR